MLNKTIQDEDSQKKIQTFKKLSDAVKSFMSFKNVTSVQMGQLIASLNDSQRGHFASPGKF
jgi:hypothetical protein